jgi:hypothetical protein
LQKRRGDSVFDDIGALRSDKKKMLDAIAAQKKEFVTRPDHQRLDDAQSFLRGATHNAGHTEAPRRKPRDTEKAADEKQRREISSEIENIHARHSSGVTLSGG